MEYNSGLSRLRSKLQQMAGDALKALDEEISFHRKMVRCRTWMGWGKAPPFDGSAVSLPGRMTNQQLAHEPLLDPFLQLDESGGHGARNPAFHGVRESLHRAFWDSIEGDVAMCALSACVCVCACMSACVRVCSCACVRAKVCVCSMCVFVSVRLRGWRAVGYGAWARVRGHDACGWRGGMSACACGHSTQPRPAADFPGPRIPGQF